jgi:hypothetical protein
MTLPGKDRTPMRKILFLIALLCSIGALVSAPLRAAAEDHIVYSVYKSLDMGNPGEKPQKDFYINMGKANGLNEGAVLDVYRRVSSYDLLSEKLYRDLTFPFAKIKVIHAEPNAAIARLEKMLPDTEGPAMSPRAVMVGDIVKLGN